MASLWAGCAWSCRHGGLVHETRKGRGLLGPTAQAHTPGVGRPWRTHLTWNLQHARWQWNPHPSTHPSLLEFGGAGASSPLLGYWRGNFCSGWEVKLNKACAPFSSERPHRTTSPTRSSVTSSNALGVCSRKGRGHPLLGHHVTEESSLGQRAPCTTL